MTADEAMQLVDNLCAEVLAPLGDVDVTDVRVAVNASKVTMTLSFERDDKDDLEL